MKSIVYQSYRTSNVPEWIKICMLTVKAWAESNAFEYTSLDDSFFAYAPQWFRDKVNHDVCPVTDLARLIFAKKLLSQGYDRTVWIDADMLVFDPEKLVIDLERDFLFCHEVWIYTDSTGAHRASHRVNNSITAFCKNNVHLDFFIDACLRIGRHRASIGKLDIGTNFLSQLHSIVPYPLLENVGMLSPAMMEEIILGKPERLIEYAQRLNSALACVNLCASLHGRRVQGFVADSSLYENVVRSLLSSRGDVINRLRRQGL